MRRAASLRLALRRRSRDMGRRMTVSLGLGCPGILYKLPQDGRSSAFFLPLPASQTEAWLPSASSAVGVCSERSCFGTLLATDWCWTRHVVGGSAGLGTALLAVRGAALTAVSWSSLTGHTVQSWPLQVNAAFHVFTVGADLLVWCLKVSCQRAGHLRQFFFSECLTGLWREMHRAAKKMGVYIRAPEFFKLPKNPKQVL